MNIFGFKRIKKNTSTKKYTKVQTTWLTKLELTS